MNDFPDWLTKAINHLRFCAQFEMTPQEWATHIHEALEIVEAEKYATPETRFEFVLSGATDEDLAQIRAGLTPFENSVVHLKSHPATSSHAPRPKITQL